MTLQLVKWSQNSEKTFAFKYKRPKIGSWTPLENYKLIDYTNLFIL